MNNEGELSRLSVFGQAKLFSGPVFKRVHLKGFLYYYLLFSQLLSVHVDRHCGRAYFADRS